MKIYVELFARSPRLMAALILGNKSDCPSHLNVGNFPILWAHHMQKQTGMLTDDVSWIMDEAAWLEQWSSSEANCRSLQKKLRSGIFCKIFKTGAEKMMKFITRLPPLLAAFEEMLLPWHRISSNFSAQLFLLHRRQPEASHVKIKVFNIISFRLICIRLSQITFI